MQKHLKIDNLEFINYNNYYRRFFNYLLFTKILEYNNDEIMDGVFPFKFEYSCRKKIGDAYLFLLKKI